MRKDEYLHLHALYVELRRYLQEIEEVPPRAFAYYDVYDVAPISLHRQKDQHHEALNRLRTGVLITIKFQHRPATESSKSTQPLKADSSPL